MKKPKKLWDKRCPVCKGKLEFRHEERDNKGVIESVDTIVCTQCNYRDKPRNRHNREELESDW